MFPSTAESVCTHADHEGGDIVVVNACKAITSKKDCDLNFQCLWNPVKCSDAIVDAEKGVGSEFTNDYKSKDPTASFSSK